MPRSRGILRWLNIGVVLLYILSENDVGIAQEKSIKEAKSMNQQAMDLYKQGHYEEAIPLAEGALAIREQVLGREHPNTATSVNNLALLYEATGAYAKAEPLYQRVLEIDEKVLGANHPDTSTSLNNLASLYRATGAYAKAEPLFQRALVIREKVLGPDHSKTATSVNNLAHLYHVMGAYGQAEPLYQRALAIWEKALGPDHPETSTALNNLASLYEDAGAYAKAEPVYQRALTIREKVLGADHPNTARSLNNLASLYEATGVYAKAEPLLQRALAIREKVLGRAHPDTARSLNNLAELYRVTGAHAKAEPLYQQALASTEKGLGPDHPDTARSLNNLAVLYEDTGAYGKAEPMYKRALAIWEQVLGPDHPSTTATLNNLAHLYHTMGAYGQAEPLYQRALVSTEKVLGPNHPDTARSLNNLALLYHSTGAYAKAEPLLQQALASTEKGLGPNHPDTAMSLNNLAGLYWVTGDLTRARSLISRAQAIEGKNLSAFLFLVGAESRKRAYLERVYGQTSASTSLSFLMRDHQATELGLQSVLMVKGRVLDSMSDSTARLRASVKPEDLAIVEELITVAQQRSTLTYRGIGNLKSEVYRQRLQELVARQEQLETALSAHSSEFRQDAAPITLAAVQVAIPKGAALIEWYRYEPFHPKAKNQQSRWGKPRYVAYVPKREVEPVVVDVGDADMIEELVHDFRTGLNDQRSTYVKDVAKELDKKLYKPLQQHVGDAKHLLISADGALNLLPFAALLDEQGIYLGSKKEITYLTSGRDLLRFESSFSGKGETVIVADPDYGKVAAVVAKGEVSEPSKRSADLDRGGMDFKPLPGSADEAKTLKTLLKVSDASVLTQTIATEARLKQLHGPHILHIATHGFFLKDNELPAAVQKPIGFSQDHITGPIGENPLLRSGLALSGANQRRSGENDDGILTAAEVAQMDLRGTQLVVLSACETGVGDVQNGEGVYGLRRALVLAGAETQVTSLWKVADEATKDLMVDYYQRLLKGEGRSEALRNAQLSMMKSKNRSHPYYWAAFVPIGDWRPIGVTK